MSAVHAVGWINTYTGRKFPILDPKPEDIDIIDIAHALSQLARFTGHTRVPYYIGHHSVLASLYCDPADALWGLLHDATEAYINDMSRPLKHCPEMAMYRKIEDQLQATICIKFGLPFTQPASVKEVDKLLVATEAHQLLPKVHPEWSYNTCIEGLTITPWGAAETEARFYQRFQELTQ